MCARSQVPRYRQEPLDTQRQGQGASEADLERLRFATIVESSDDGIVSKDLDGTIRSWNPGAERIFGYTAAEMIGDSIFRLIPPELHAEECGLLGHIRQGEHIAHYETDRLRKDGRRIRISLTLSPLIDGEGRLIGASAIKRDVTAQRTLENQLQQAQKMEAVGRLAGGIAHDFNNLLTVIGGLTTLFRPHLPEETGRPRQNLEQIILAAERAGALTQQLLMFSRPQVATVEVLDLGRIAKSIEALLRPLLGEHIAFQVTVLLDDVRVHGNRSQLEQIIMNLTINGRDAMPTGGRLSVEIAAVQLQGHHRQEGLQLEPGPYVTLVVRDTGHGIDAETRASIFEPFFSTRRPGEGTGLGLATVHAIVQRAGGAIDVQSTVGRGSTFTVYLPQVGVESQAPFGMKPSGHPANQLPARGTILLVEDEPGVRTFAAQVLDGEGYRVIEAGSGEEALAVASSFAGTFDLLVTDVVMAGINGRVLCERLRARFPNLCCLYTSGYTDDMVLHAGVVTDDTIFLAKPFAPEQLTERVRHALNDRVSAMAPERLVAKREEGIA